MLANGESGVLERVFDAEPDADGNSRSEETPQADYLKQLVKPLHYATSSQPIRSLGLMCATRQIDMILSAPGI